MGRMVELVLVAAIMGMMTGCVGEQTKGASGTSSSSSPQPTSAVPPTISPSATSTPISPTPTITPNSTAQVPSTTTTPTPSVKPSLTSYAKEADAKKTIENRTKETIQALKEKDLKKLAELIHPKKGVQFSPYSYIHVSSDVQVLGSGLAALWANTSTTHWGDYDGSGDPIDLTLPNYWDKFVYNEDFAAAPQISYNIILGKGNMINNVFSIYPTTSAITVEYHYPGLDPQFQGMDWTSLRLVYESSGTQWYLVAIVHDQHTM
ncbi:hypothetical protein HQN89_14040 [Paenibacillus frigoriresistens]|uniref:hypothetical protein n=1 Tax=Paenibacillus alginolyticus TaxID=59839 RepID=UPI001566E9E4|nr:hypothetical protein [Paenibacillus frigoriresistens]NRF92127.1 hypothetical protein [Paenibacillus frigoriresistens]